MPPYGLVLVITVWPVIEGVGGRKAARRLRAVNHAVSARAVAVNTADNTLGSDPPCLACHSRTAA